MKFTGAYALVLVLHLLTVAFAVGPAAVIAMSSARHIRAGRAETLREAARTTRVLTMATFATVLLGSALVGLGDIGGQWQFSQPWIGASYVLWFLAVGVTTAVVVPAQLSAADTLDAGQDASGLATRITASSSLVTVLWTAIIVLMVVKPGA